MKRWLRRLALIALWLVGGLVALWLVLIVAYRWIDPPVTPLMLLRLPAMGKIDHRPVPLTRVSVNLQHAVIASEDNNFCTHHGVDWGAMHEAVDDYQDRGRLRGASTITMQVARNLFLWPGGGVFRKGVEIALALSIDALWPKRRILEVYLDIAELGPGLYGAEAASEAWFHQPAARLSRHDGASLAAILPSPLHWSPTRQTAYIALRVGSIEGREDKLAGYFGCLG